MNSGCRDGPYASLNESRKRLAAYVPALKVDCSSLIRTTIIRRYKSVVEDFRRAVRH